MVFLKPIFVFLNLKIAAEPKSALLQNALDLGRRPGFLVSSRTVLVNCVSQGVCLFHLGYEIYWRKLPVVFLDVPFNNKVRVASSPAAEAVIYVPPPVGLTGMWRDCVILFKEPTFYSAALRSPLKSSQRSCAWLPCVCFALDLLCFLGL